MNLNVDADVLYVKRDEGADVIWSEYFRKLMIGMNANGLNETVRYMGQWLAG